jgi:Domain of unknown function (DUF4129)
MRSSWGSRILLPATQLVAEGSWLAVWYAALQAAVGEPIWIGPLELATIAWAGMAWGRRNRWRSPAAEALGLPLLALAFGAVGWVIDPHVRQQLVRGELLAALSLHVTGWIGALAFWRGEVHRSADDDDAIQDRVLRWGVPALAIPWAIGHLASSGAMEDEFTAAAFIATIFFVSAAFVAMGLARLEAVRASTGSDWRANRSWVAVLLGTAVAVTLLAIPAASLLGIPAGVLLVALLGPLQALLLVLLLLATPVILLGAAVADLIGPLIPEGFSLGEIRLPDLTVDLREVTTQAPVIIFYVVVAVIFVLELIVVALILWIRWQERKRMRMAVVDEFEERSIVIPSSAEPVPPAARPRRRRAARWGSDPASAYLQALEALKRDGRWPRHASETPAGHAHRVASEGLELPALRRLAVAYQLVRYGGRTLSSAEATRASPRLRALRERLRG